MSGALSGRNISLQRLDGYDFRNDSTAWVSEEYSTYLYGNETIRMMQEYVDDDDSDPFFILFSSQAAHTPYDAPQEFLDRYDGMNDTNRQELAAVITVLDDTLGEIVQYLQSDESGYLWNNTLLIVTSDNGADHAYGLWTHQQLQSFLVSLSDEWLIS